jgi:hypothetical protein
MPASMDTLVGLALSMVVLSNNLSPLLQPLFLVKKVLEGTVSLPGKYSKLIDEAIPGYKEESLTLVGAEA